MQMTIDKTLDKMDDLLNEGVAMPLTGRRLIDVEKMQDLITAPCAQHRADEKIKYT